MKNINYKIFFILVFFLFLSLNAKQNANAIGIYFSDATYSYGSTIESYPVSCGCVLPVPSSGTLTFEVYAYGDIMDWLELSADPLPAGAVFPTVSGALFVHSTFTWSFAIVDSMPSMAGFKITPFSPPWCYINFDVLMPVELSSFTSTVYENDVKLNWTTESENNNKGFDLERKFKTEEATDWILIGSIQGNGNSNVQNNYNFTDMNLNSGTYQYRLKQTDFNGSSEYFYLNNDVHIGVPVKYSLQQNYPNPFNPVTNVEFGIPEPGFVSLKVYDIYGKEIATLVNENLPPGNYTVKFNGSNLSSGVYFCAMKVKDFVTTVRMVLEK